jgi:hypothetical protein
MGKSKGRRHKSTKCLDNEKEQICLQNANAVATEQWGNTLTILEEQRILREQTVVRMLELPNANGDI